MKKKTAFLQELNAIIRSKKLLIPIIGVLFVPVLYAGMFLWAFWDPYENLSKLPVAVVNLDKGANFEGEELQVGKDFIDELKDNDKFGWEFVTKEEAEKGFENRKYYMMIQIPENFSENATTLTKEDPTQLELFYIPNESLNFLSSQIGESGMDKIKAELQKTITKTYVEKVFAQVSDGLKEATDGASKLHDGSTTAKDGAIKLSDGLATAKDGSTQLTNGLGTAASGSNSLKEGLSIANQGVGLMQSTVEQQMLTGASQLKDGADTLATGATQVKDGLVALQDGSGALVQGSNQLKDGLGQLATATTGLGTQSVELNKGAQSVAGGLESIKATIEKLANGLPPEQKEVFLQTYGAILAGSQQVAEGTNELSKSAPRLEAGIKASSDGAAALTAGLNTKVVPALSALVDGQTKVSNGAKALAEGQQQAKEGVTLLNEKLKELKAGTSQLSAGSQSLEQGLAKLKAGSSQLDSGVGQLYDGSSSLADGLGKIEDGTKELATGLDESATEAEQNRTNNKELNMFAEPVKVEIKKVGEVPNYGTGFAPYFLSLGLFVGALLISIVFPLREALGESRTAFGRLIGKSGILMLVGIIQSLIADAILIWGLGIEVQSLPIFIGFSILTSWTFLAIVQFLVTVFGDAGRFLAIIVLILQLTTSAGTFPLEVIPEPLQIFNTWLPMTYSVSGFKAVISSGDYQYLWENIGVLLTFTGVMLTGTYSYFLLNKKRFNTKMNSTSAEIM